MYKPIEPGKINLTVQTAKPVTLEIEVSGYRQEPKIMIKAPAEIHGKRIAGRATIDHPPKSDIECIMAPNRVCFVAGGAADEIRAAIEKLPEREYWIYLENPAATFDGNLMPYEKWYFEAQVPGVPNRYIERMLSAAGITEIRVEDATEMWEEQQAEKRRPYLIEAQRTGKPVELSRKMVECNDPRESCDADLLIRYILPDGTIYEERQHTY